jgi:hypothetical protein
LEADISTLSIHVRSGLCNRLRPILSAIAFCEQSGHDLEIHWPHVDQAERGGGGVFEATLSDLFTHPFKEVVHQTEKESEAACWANRNEFIRQQQITLATRGNKHMRTINMFPGKEPPEGFPHKNESHQFLAENGHYQKSFAEYWSVMQPAPAVQSWIDAGAELIAGRPTVAVMIRFAVNNPGNVDLSTIAKYMDALGSGKIWTDHNFETSLRSPPDKFIARMKQFPENTQFFLATDCLFVEQMIREAFPGRIVQLPQTYRYDRETIQKRTAELYIAARCDRILGSYISSYCEFAGWLAGGKYSACYLWPAGENEKYEDVGLWEAQACK